MPDIFDQLDEAPVGDIFDQAAAVPPTPAPSRAGFATEAARGLTQFFPAGVKTASVIGEEFLDRPALGVGPSGRDVLRAFGVNTQPDAVPESRPLYKAGEWMERALERAYPSVPEDQRHLGHDVVRGLGQIGSMLVGGAATRAAGASVKGAAVAATALGFGQEFDDAFTRSRQRGDDPDTALAKSLGYGTVSAMIENKLGAGRILKKYFPDPAVAARKLSAWGITKSTAASLAVGFGEEGSQRFAQNWIVEGKPSLEGVVQEGLPGGIVQAIAELPANLLRVRGGPGGGSRRSRLKQPTGIPPVIAPPTAETDPSAELERGINAALEQETGQPDITRDITQREQSDGQSGGGTPRTLAEIDADQKSKFAKVVSAIQSLFPGIKIALAPDKTDIRISSDGQTLEVSPTLLDDISKMYPGQEAEALRLAIEEEQIHHNDIKTLGKDFKQRLSDVWTNAPKEIRKLVRAAYGDANITADEWGAELLRMARQAARSGRITESIHPRRGTAAQNAIEALKQWASDNGITEGETDASQITSTTEVGVRGQGGAVGAATPLRQQGQAPGARPAVLTPTQAEAVVETPRILTRVAWETPAQFELRRQEYARTGIVPEPPPQLPDVAPPPAPIVLPKIAPVVFDSLFMGRMPTFRVTQEITIPINGVPEVQPVGSRITLEILQKAGLQIPEAELAKATSQINAQTKEPTTPPLQPTKPVGEPATASVGDLPPVKPGFVRMYHGGADPTGKLSGDRDITMYFNYAKGYADKNNYPVWYVDVPENSPFMKLDEGASSPTRKYWVNTKAPADVMLNAKPVAKPATAGTEKSQGPNQPFPELTPEENARQVAQARRLVEERYRFASPEVLSQKLAEFDAKNPPTPPVAEPPAGKPVELKIGDEQVIMDVPSVLADTQTVGGVKWDLFNGAKLKEKRSAVRTIDVESGEVLQLKQFPDYDSAEAYYKSETAKANKMEQPAGKPAVPGEAKAKEPWEMTKAEYIGDKMRPLHDVESARKEFESLIGTDAQARKTPRFIQAERNLKFVQEDNKIKQQANESDRGLFERLHRQKILDARDRGETIPPEVLADYPDLAKPSAPTTETTGGKPVISKKEQADPRLLSDADLAAEAKAMDDAASPFYAELEAMPESETFIPRSTKYTPKAQALHDKIEPFARRKELLQHEISRRKMEAMNKAASEARDKRIAAAPVYQRRNGWEIVKEMAQYALRNPFTKEEVYIGRLERVREVADESKPESPAPAGEVAGGKAKPITTDAALKLAEQRKAEGKSQLAVARELSESGLSDGDATGIAGQVFAKSETPAKAVAKVKTEVKSVARTQGQRSAKEIKAELITRLQQAAEDAPANSEFNSITGAPLTEKAKTAKPTITIEIPGDGEFRPINRKENIAEILVQAKRVSTTAGTPQKVGTSRAIGTVSEQAKAVAKAYGSAENAYRSTKRQRDELQSQGPPANSEDRNIWNDQIAKADALLRELYENTQAGKLEVQAEAARDRVATYKEGAKGFESEIARIEAIKRKTQAHKDRLADLKERYAENQAFIKTNERNAENWEQQSAKEKAALEATAPPPGGIETGSEGGTNDAEGYLGDVRPAAGGPTNPVGDSQDKPLDTGGSGSASLVQRGNSGGLSESTAQTVIDSWRAEQSDAPEVQIVNRPDWTQTGSDGRQYGVRGFWDGQKIIVNLAHIANEAGVREVLNHELVHPLLDSPQGGRAIEAAINQELGRVTLARIRQRYKRGENESAEQYQRRIMAEWFAQLKESNQTLWQRIVARVREFLAKAGIVNLSDDEIGRAMLRALENTNYERDTITGQPTRITGRKVSVQQARMVAADSSRISEAIQRVHGQSPVGGTDADYRQRLAAEGIHVINLPDTLGINPGNVARKEERDWKFVPSTKMRGIGAGHEAIAYQSPLDETVYKIFVPTADGIGAFYRGGIGANGQVDATVRRGTLPELVAKIDLLNQLGGTPTEIVGVSPEGYLVVKQPYQKPGQWSVANRAAEFKRMGLTRVPSSLVKTPAGISFDVFGVVYRGEPWLVGDLRDANLGLDTQSKVRVFDLSVAKLSWDELGKNPKLEQFFRGLPEAEGTGKAERMFSLTPEPVDARTGAEEEVRGKPPTIRVQGVPHFVRSAKKLDQEAGRQQALTRFVSVGLDAIVGGDGNIHLRDESGTFNYNAEARALLPLAQNVWQDVQEMARAGAEPNDLTVRFLDSVRNLGLRMKDRLRRGETAAINDLTLINDLVQAGHQPIRQAAQLLQAVQIPRKDFVVKMQQVDAEFEGVLSHKYGGDQVNEILQRVFTTYREFFTPEEVARIIKERPDFAELERLVQLAQERERGGRVYRDAQNKLKPKVAKTIEQLERLAKIEEAVKEIIQQFTKAGGTVPLPKGRKLTAKEKLELLTRPETAEELDAAIARAVWQAQRNAARPLAAEELTGEELAAYDARTQNDELGGPDPTPEQIEQGLNAPKYAHWRLIRDNLTSYAPVTQPLVKKLLPKMHEMVATVLSTPAFKRSEYAERFANMLVDDAGVDPSQRERVIRLFTNAFEAKLKEAEARAIEKAWERLDPSEKAEPKRRKLFEKIKEAVTAGALDNLDILKKLAESHGESGFDETIAEIKKLVEREQRLRTVLTPAAIKDVGLTEEQVATYERTGAGLTPEQTEKYEQAKALQVGAYDTALSDIHNRLVMLWAKLNNPVGFNSVEAARNVVRGMNELSPANLLTRWTFATVQTIDIVTQLLSWTVTTSAAHARLRTLAIPKSERRAVDWLANYAEALADAFKTTKQVMGSGTAATWLTLRTGRGLPQRVEGIETRIHAVERIIDHAKKLLASDDPVKQAQGALEITVAQVQIGYRIAGGLDQFQAASARFKELQGMIKTYLRTQNPTSSRAQIAMLADKIMGDLKSEFAVALTRAPAILAAADIKETKTGLRVAAWNMVWRSLIERVRAAGLPVDDLQNAIELRMQTMGWNRPETGVIGRIIATPMKGLEEFFSRMLIPTGGATAFANAAATSIARKLHFTPIGFFPKIFGESPWTETRLDEEQRKAEAGMMLLPGVLLMIATASGLLKYILRWPDDPEEKAKMEATGLRPGVLLVPVGNDRYQTISGTAGVLSLPSPYLAMGARINQILADREKKQAKLNEEARKAGVEPSKLPPVSFVDLLSVAAEGAANSVTGTRTTGGRISHWSDYGKLLSSKAVASYVSASIPFLPLWQNTMMLAGSNVDPKLASFWDLIVPVPGSDAQRMNIFGEPVGSAQDFTDKISMLTRGSGKLVDGKKLDNTAYANVFATGYIPAPVSVDRGFNIGGEFRPMTQQELRQYVQRRGQLWKERLESIGPVDGMEPAAARRTVQQAFQSANQQALIEVGVISRGTRTSASAIRPLSVSRGLSLPTGTRRSTRRYGLSSIRAIRFRGTRGGVRRISTRRRRTITLGRRTRSPRRFSGLRIARIRRPTIRQFV